MLNLAARLIINLLIPDLETFLKSHFMSSHYSVSSFMEHENTYFNYDMLCALQITKSNTQINVELFCSDPNEERKEKITKHYNDNLYNLKVILNFIFKTEFQIILKKTISNVQNSEKKIRLDISFKAEDDDLFLSLIIPFEFIRLFSKKINSFNAEFFEELILNYFLNPVNYFPNLELIFNTLNEAEIQKLLYHLQKKNLLTQYQISLILLSFPQHTLLIKKNLSLNTVKDVERIMRNLSVNKRDLAGGIYSIEESIFILMKNNDNFAFSVFMLNMQKWLRIFQNSRLVLKRTFIKWIEEIDSSGELYNTISYSRDSEIAKCISDNPDIYHSFFSKHLSGKRLEEIISIIKKKNFSVFERIESQADFISKYKKLKIQKMKMSHEAFPVILRKLDKNELIYLLFGVGWFIMSTALKNMNKNKILSLIENLPLGAKYLIIDVLQGIVNPNIIHDEIQINKARSVCVNELISLYQDGIIDLLN
ncbi:MAG: hypothetical protein V1874_07320 [Spirochaetota bacterium]